jgi:peptidyl-tRNA hydrolase, PTH1 family
MWLVVGLGNPGREYEQTRHNVGFMAVEVMGAASRAVWQTKFSSELAQLSIAGTSVVVQKPNTFMNLSGKAVQAAMAFYKLPIDNIIVIHDDLDLELGQIKLKRGGSHGGHNGLKSIDGLIGQNYLRVRAGIGHPRHAGPADAPPRTNVVSHVLGPFRGTDATIAKTMVDHCAAAANLLVTMGVEKGADEALKAAQLRYHSLKPAPPPQT